VGLAAKVSFKLFLLFLLFPWEWRAGEIPPSHRGDVTFAREAGRNRHGLLTGIHRDEE
jgi:hypothetical protein